MNSISNVEVLSSTKVGHYCSNGFRNVNYSFSDFTLYEKILKSNLHVSFSKPTSSEPWLSKPSFRPQLRTCEYVVVSILMSELYLSLAYRISQEDLTKSWVKQVKLKNTPQIVSDFIQPISVARIHSVKLSPIQMESSFEIAIGETEIELTIAHSNTSEKEIDDCILSEAYNDFACFLQNLNLNFYKVGYKSLNHLIHDIKTEPDLMIASAQIRQIATFNRHLGIGSHFIRTMDIASFILVSSQIIQVLLYAMDDSKIVKADDLWVRGLEINYPAPMSIDSMKEYVKCKSLKTVRYQGKAWKMADMRVTLGNIQAKFDVAYQDDGILTDIDE